MYVPQSLWSKVGSYTWSKLKQNNFSLDSMSVAVKYKRQSRNTSELLFYFLNLQFINSFPVIDAVVCLKLVATTYLMSACERSHVEVVIT
jgi:hypothetical protein